MPPENKLIVVNHSREMDYNKQRDNVIMPLSTCGPTSMAMALLQAGYRDWLVEGEDPADTITNHLTSKQAYDRMHRVLGTKETVWKPFNIHGILTWGVNTFLKQEVSTFKTDWSLQQILLNIVQGGSAVLAGDFTLPDGRELGHIVSLAGFATNQQNIMDAKKPADVVLAEIPYFIVDDPYGNYMDGYRSHHGMNIEFDYQTFYNVMRVNGSYQKKWAHLIKPAS